MSETGLILAVETSSRIGSAAIARGDELLAEKAFSAPLRHSAEVFPAICELLSRFELRPAQIEQVYVSGGPGSFTGLRIAVTLAKTMYLATGVKIVSVDTLDVVAANVIGLTEDDVSNDMPKAAGCERVATIVDAKRGQFFVAVYEHDHSDQRRPEDPHKWTKVVPDCLTRPENFVSDFAASDRDIWLLGDGLLYYKERFRAQGIHFFDQKFWSPRAAKVYLLGRQKAARGEFADPLTLVPNYLRGPDVKSKAQ
ncbi:MAG: tRNA (adenosine(37)-N6)-threonylcarbamoyltransferase complex dimerization subunit type 1 TsaB [Phycisphaerales bacterium]|nr:MAG: tRNA (adenosine(37)-N6)-threonylcarbamoyltransferase complex dimerization subunit type 1 TsaB [Phycisphaerales bacterium]